MYKSIIRPCLFRIDAEKIHDQIITLLHIYASGPIRSLTRSLFHPQGCSLPMAKSELEQSMLGLLGPDR